MNGQRSWVRFAIEPGYRCSAGLARNTASSAAGSIAAISAASRWSDAQPPLEQERRAEGPLHRDLLVEQHPDQHGERLLREQPVGLGVGREVQRVGPVGACPNYAASPLSAPSPGGDSPTSGTRQLRLTDSPARSGAFRRRLNCPLLQTPSRLLSCFLDPEGPIARSTRRPRARRRTGLRRRRVRPLGGDARRGRAGAGGVLRRPGGRHPPGPPRTRHRLERDPAPPRRPRHRRRAAHVRPPRHGGPLAVVRRAHRGGGRGAHARSSSTGGRRSPSRSTGRPRSSRWTWCAAAI